HKTALTLVRAYDTVYYENLQVANLLRNKYLAKSIMDAAWSQFCRILVYKAACAGKRAVAVSPRNTTQQCSNQDCGKIVPKGLSVRWHRCSHCGIVLDRDENAARNILRVGLEADAQWLGQSLRGVEA
ncbi:MAG: RNA-guided endonuclease InsQ/TnpB family protein, partial [Ktedonobacterales bacterium]